MKKKGLTDEAIRAVDWKNSQLCELDISSTDLSEETLIEFLTNLPKLSYLAVSFCDGFTDKVSRKTEKKTNLLFIFRIFSRF